MPSLPSVSARVNLTQIYVDVLSKLHVMLRHNCDAFEIIMVHQSESHVYTYRGKVIFKIFMTCQESNKPGLKLIDEVNRLLSILLEPNSWVRSIIRLIVYTNNETTKEQIKKIQKIINKEHILKISLLFYFAHLHSGAVDVYGFVRDIWRIPLLNILKYPLLVLHKFYFVQQVVRDSVIAQQGGCAAMRYVLRRYQLHVHVTRQCRVWKS